MRPLTAGCIALCVCASVLADDALTDEAFFEYLGQFADGGAEWMDPQHLELLAGGLDDLAVDVNAPATDTHLQKIEADNEATSEHRSADDE